MTPSYGNACLCTSSLRELHAGTQRGRSIWWRRFKDWTKNEGGAVRSVPTKGKLESQNQHSMHTTEPRSRHPLCFQAIMKPSAYSSRHTSSAGLALYTIGSVGVQTDRKSVV